MGESKNIKSIDFPIKSYFNIIDFLEDMGVETFPIAHAKRINIELDMITRKGNVYIVLQDTIPKMEP
jgi:hypothetical protein